MFAMQLALVVLAFIATVSASAVMSEFRMCVPHINYDACKELAENQPSNIAKLKCVVARDRMQCLDKVIRREADFLVADPEDMYVAAVENNEDFILFSQIRTTEESEADYRYMGIMLVHKNSNINSLGDLKGKKSCHTGFGRNVGYKIPITKLKKSGVLHVSSDNQLTSVEKELSSLSELFSQSCLVGDYSPDANVNRLFKKRYSNLCALCEDPVKCNYPDKYSGYEGAIRCLVENGGDVAFTKVIFVRRFFGLPIGNRSPTTPAQADVDDYEYLCADGSRRPVTGDACSWAQRPWAGYIANSDVKPFIAKLQQRVREYYESSKNYSNKTVAAKLGILDKYTVVNSEIAITPNDHLTNAQYKDVIERDGTTEQKIRLCVRSLIELTKCRTLAKVAYSRDIRPEIQCHLSGDCIESVASNQTDVIVLPAADQTAARKKKLVQILQEISDFQQFVVVADGDITRDVLAKLPLSYDTSDENSRNAANLFNHLRGINKCSPIRADANNLRLIKTKEINNKTTSRDRVICLDLTKKPLTNYEECDFDPTPPTSVFVRDSLYGHELDNIIHTFKLLVDKFGTNNALPDVFELFGTFEPNAANVIFTDNAQGLQSPPHDIGPIVDLYARVNEWVSRACTD